MSFPAPGPHCWRLPAWWWYNFFPGKEKLVANPAAYSDVVLKEQLKAAFQNLELPLAYLQNLQLNVYSRECLGWLYYEPPPFGVKKQRQDNFLKAQSFRC